MTLRAYAKINLGLHVIGKRPDGYHDIETVFHQVDLFDEIDIVQNNEDIQFTSDTPELPSDSSNLCVQTVKVLRDLTGIHSGVEIALRKRIPIGAGLGGGSSDAAAVLRGLTRLWNLDIPDDELRTIGASLGSDVPFFLVGGTAFATGRGDVLQPLNLAIPYWILIATPPLHISTAWAYENLRLAEEGARREECTRQPPSGLVDLLQSNAENAKVLQGRLCNEFEPVVFDSFPEVRQIKEALSAHGAAIALMSGTGSSVFGFFREEATVQKLAAELSPHCRVSITEPFFKPQSN